MCYCSLVVVIVVVVMVAEGGGSGGVWPYCIYKIIANNLHPRITQGVVTTSVKPSSSHLSHTENYVYSGRIHRRSDPRTFFLPFFFLSLVLSFFFPRGK